MRKTKIICTIGPASNNEETIRGLFGAGMNAGRFNFSHGTYDEHERNIALFRKVRDELGLPGAVVLDTKGPEIRLKTFKNGSVEVQDGQKFTISTRDIEGDEHGVSISFDKFAQDVNKGTHVLIDDGKIVMRVDSCTDTDVELTVLHGGVISDHKGVNIPNAELSLPFMSDQDKADLLFGIEQGVDYVAASFVRTADDVRQMRHFLEVNGGKDIQIIAKIESAQGVKNFEDILKEVDGIMIARGDMGVEIPFEKVPGIQKRFIRRCVQSGKIVITATQMLESMISSPLPTRAEITDVANAVYEGTSAVMLSGETAAGEFPVEAVQAMSRIALQAEEDKKNSYSAQNEQIWHEMDTKDVTNAVGHAASVLAHDLEAKCIFAITQTGFTARRLSKFQPDIPIIGATPDEKTFHQLALVWGVQPLRAEQKARLTELYRHCVDQALKKHFISEGSLVVMTAGVPIGRAGDTNIIRVMYA
ncbi:MAG: pyruvate kinase [Eubacterium sp.]|jgi:pyruvate kinase|nr:pyruvate kinase [Eubacterium sp.]MCH4046307.1 pyruvate kinase [Eubacterium sp.]MCH4079402.1 pyruvate kinase [Eubacterium sp.]MCI1307129.1 pyruvate kinase [Eubacterium sp.]MCI1405644.1 pyruvate kinase [Eubacterium sp.]